jgi:hypothetical protein
MIRRVEIAKQAEKQLQAAGSHQDQPDDLGGRSDSMRRKCGVGYHDEPLKGSRWARSI